MDKNKLLTEVEKTFHRLITDEIKEQVVDFTVLWVQKNKLPVDRNSMTQVLEVVRIAVDDAYYKNIDKMLGKLSNSIDEFVSDTSPLEPTK